MTTVSRDWNNFIGERRQARKLRVCIDCNQRKLTPEWKNVLMNSKRSYENIKIEISWLNKKSLQFSLDFLREKSRPWKDVIISLPGFILSQRIFLKMLQIIERSLQKLQIRNLLAQIPEEESNEVRRMMFPYLNSLSCLECGNSVFNYFVHVTSLIEFKFAIQRTEQQEVTSLHKILIKNQNLKNLEACPRDSSFFDNLTQVKFKLQKLRIFLLDYLEYSPAILQFLRNQEQTLEWINIQTLFDQQLVELLLGMPRLTSLGLGTFVSLGIENLPVNTRITSLELDQEKEHDEGEQIAFKRLIQALPKLKQIKCLEIEEENLAVEKF